MQAPRSLWLVVCLGCEHTAVVGPKTVDHKMPEDPDLDVLFVIDNSASTADKQMLFAQNFPILVTKLDSNPEGRPNLHVGVVSTTVGLGTDVDFGSSCGKTMPNDDGLLQNTSRISGCTGPTGRFISDVGDSMGRITNYSGTLADTFSCIAQLGTTGCGFEAPLEAMKRALDGSRPENAGFLRPDAELAVIILTDEDDCSAADPSIFALNNVGPGDFRCQPLFAYDCASPISAAQPGDYADCKPHHGGYLADPQTYVDFLKTIKDPSQTFVGLIAGDPEPVIHTGQLTTPFAQPMALQPSCSATISGNPVIARPAIRLAEFLGAYDEDHGSFASACQADYSAALGMFGDDMLTMMGPCFASDIDALDNDPNVPGIQPACAIAEQHPNQPDEPSTLIPACDMLSDGTTPSPTGPRPCWWAAPSNECPANGLSLHIDRVTPAEPGSVIDELCAAPPQAR